MENKLTLEKAKELAAIHLLGMKNGDFIFLHSKNVSEIAIILSEGKKVDKDILRTAGWVHDIGKSVSEENHEIYSIEILEKDYILDDKLKDCILNHGTSGKPITEEGKIFRIADKASILDRDTIFLLIKENKGKIKKEDIEFIKLMTEKAVERLGEV